MLGGGNRLLYPLTFFDMKNENYVNIQGWMINQLGLKGNKLTLYALIYGFSQDGENEYKASFKYIGKALGIKDRQAINIVNWLVDNNYIIKTQGGGEDNNSYKYNPDLCKNCIAPMQKIAYPPMQKLHSSNNNIYINNSNKVDEEKNLSNSPLDVQTMNNPPQVPPAPPFDEVFKYFEDCFKIKIIAKSDTRKKKIKARLKTFTLEQIKEAIKNFSQDSFYAGDNDRGWKANLDFIIRSDEIIERGLNLKPNQKQNERPRKGIAKF